jgi:hypothetical protein
MEPILDDRDDEDPSFLHDPKRLAQTGIAAAKGGACLAGAAIIAGGATFAAPILVGLAGALLAFAQLWRRYGASAPAAVSP